MAATIKHLIARVTSHEEGCVYLRKQSVYENTYRYRSIKRKEVSHVPSILIKLNLIEGIQEGAGWPLSWRGCVYAAHGGLILEGYSNIIKSTLTQTRGACAHGCLQHFCWWWSASARDDFSVSTNKHTPYLAKAPWQTVWGYRSPPNSHLSDVTVGVSSTEAHSNAKVWCTNSSSKAGLLVFI